MAVKVFLRDLIQRYKIIQRSIVHENIDATKTFVRCGEELLYRGRLCDICLKCDPCP